MNRTRLYITMILAMAAVIGLLSVQTFAYEISWSVLQKGSAYFQKIQSDPRLLAEEFCEAEFNGAQDMRMKVAKFTLKNPADEKKGDPDKVEKAGPIINFYSDPLVVVDSYHIRGFTSSNNRAEVTVMYKRLANSEGAVGGKYAIDRKNQDSVTLALDYDGSRWWIMDPPLPRVSKWALIEYSERIISSMEDLIRTGKASEGQKKFYVNNKSIVIFLRSLW